MGPQRPRHAKQTEAESYQRSSFTELSMQRYESRAREIDKEMKSEGTQKICMIIKVKNARISIENKKSDESPDLRISRQNLAERKELPQAPIRCFYLRSAAECCCECRS